MAAGAELAGPVIVEILAGGALASSLVANVTLGWHLYSTRQDRAETRKAIRAQALAEVIRDAAVAQSAEDRRERAAAEANARDLSALLSKAREELLKRVQAKLADATDLELAAELERVLRDAGTAGAPPPGAAGGGADT